ncbi:D-alanyl-D-alanine carboxypeptidase [Brevundimonas sp.]|jgi:D-alanyl-D-alanine carboxypeptidase|uniref:D-alanyl-D-alanine carboxypeptidase n=1 Tax=Brevundimonas sp. TaxID=1871086 RepID=UPI001850F4E5|nr:D-alanyl-D-alanine carboxypeptidase [Brevundimonas sp.]MBA4807523.1 D-alanyl-D-alanine carboxypeptidase [Brevundimonas sp.]
MIAFFRRGLFAVLALSLLLGANVRPIEAQSQENSRYAAIVIDAASGEVLFARHADSRRYPASLTKMMTLYLTFEALSQGKVDVDDVLTISPRAASQPPSKLGLAAGQTITLDDAMRATAVRSANDMAVAIAEHVGGSEARFTNLMTLKAEQLGMTQTRYATANGLPDARQLTSARDQAILARAIMRDFPQYYSYFGLHDWAYNGRNYRNTNGLLPSGNGYDGMKTGYTNASGYNLAASAVRDGRRLITIVLGGRSSASRNAHVAELMDTGFEVERRRSQGETIQIAQTFFEQRGFGVGSEALSPSAPVAYASLGTDDEDAMGGESTAVAYTSAPAPAALPTRITPSPSERAAAETTAQAQRAPANLTASLNGAPARRAAPPPAREPARATRPTGRWAVQVGAFKDEKVATDWLTEVNRRFRSQFASAERNVQTAGDWYRSRFTGLTEDAAKAACDALSERRVTCMVVRPD